MGYFGETMKVTVAWMDSKDINSTDTKFRPWMKIEGHEQQTIWVERTRSERALMLSERPNSSFLVCCIQGRCYEHKLVHRAVYDFRSKFRIGSSKYRVTSSRCEMCEDLNDTSCMYDDIVAKLRARL